MPPRIHSGSISTGATTGRKLIPIPRSTSSSGGAILILGAMTLTATTATIPIIAISSRSMRLIFPPTPYLLQPRGAGCQGVPAPRMTSSGTSRSGGTSCRPLVVARSQPAPTS